MTVQVRGAEQYAKLAKDLRKAGRKDLKRELTKALNRAAKPVIAAAVRETSTLPQRGGLADRARRAYGKAKISTRSGSSPRVRIRAVDSKGASVDLAALDRGTVRHPVHGDRRRWVAQPVPAGSFTRPAEAASGPVRAEVVKAIDSVTRTLNAG